MRRQGAQLVDVQVLLIGGEPVIECSVELLLTAHHLRIAASVANALEAAQVLQSARPDVVVLDLALGQEALHCVRLVRSAAPSLPILAFGGRGPWPIQELLDAGVQGFALTSTSPEAFIDAIRVVAGGSTYLEPGFAIAGRDDSARRRRPALSGRERQIMGLLAHGLTGIDVAERLFISHATVRTHVQNAMRKLGARTRAHAIAIMTGEVQSAEPAELSLVG